MPVTTRSVVPLRTLHPTHPHTVDKEWSKEVCRVCRKWVRPSTKRVAQRAFFGCRCPGATVLGQGFVHLQRPPSPPPPMQAPRVSTQERPATRPPRWDFSLAQVRPATRDGVTDDEDRVPDRPRPFVLVGPPTPAAYEHGLVFDTAMPWARTGLIKRARDDRDLARASAWEFRRAEETRNNVDILFCVALDCVEFV